MQKRTASLSVSGSFARTNDAPAASAVAIASTSPAGSSGFGKATIGNDGSGSHCSTVGMYGGRANACKALETNGAPTFVL